MPRSNAVPVEQEARWPTLTSPDVWLFPDDDQLWDLPANPTIVDFAFAVHPDLGSRLTGATINDKKVVLSRKLKPNTLVGLSYSQDAMPDRRWLEFVSSPARELIMHDLGIPMTKHQQTVYRTAMHNVRNPDKRRAFPPAAVAETARGKRVQLNRVGKKLIGAYVDEADIERLKAILKAQGTTVQEYFADYVAKTITAGASPAQREKMIEAKVRRYRATLQSTLK